jgi:putative oxidoreductase
MKKNIDTGLLILRLTLGILMFLHGIEKIQKGVSFIKGSLTDIGLPAFIGNGVYIGEILAPLMLIIGYRTRVAALIYAANCLVAILLVHASDIFTLTKHGGWGIELLGLYLFGSLTLYFTGSGKYALSFGHKWD